MNDTPENILTITSGDSPPPPLIKKHFIMLKKCQIIFFVICCIIALIFPIIGIFCFLDVISLLISEGPFLLFVLSFLCFIRDYGLQVIINFSENTVIFQLKSLFACCNREQIEYDRELIRGFKYEVLQEYDGEDSHDYYAIFVSLADCGLKEIFKIDDCCISNRQKLPEILTNLVVSGK